MHLRVDALKFQFPKFTPEKSEEENRHLSSAHGRKYMTFGGYIFNI